MFDDSFDYSQLVGKEVTFHERLNKSEFTLKFVQTQYYKFNNLEEAWVFLEEMRTPRVVIGFTKWLVNGTYEEAVKKFISRDPEWPEDKNYRSEVGVVFGAPYRAHLGAFYDIRREGPSPEGELSVSPNRLYVGKRYYTVYGSAGVWSLHIQLFDTPPFPAEFSRHPRHHVRTGF